MEIYPIFFINTKSKWVILIMIIIKMLNMFHLSSNKRINHFYILSFILKVNFFEYFQNITLLRFINIFFNLKEGQKMDQSNSFTKAKFGWLVWDVNVEKLYCRNSKRTFLLTKSNVAEKSLHFTDGICFQKDFKIPFWW